MKSDFYREMSKNNWKTVLLFIMFFILVMLFGVAFGAYFGDIYFGVGLAVFVGLIYTLIAYNFGASTVLASLKAKPVTAESDPYLYNVVDGLRIAAGLHNIPKIYTIDESSMNAFATGVNPEKSYICVTSGLRKHMNRAELEGVIAHEMSHIRNKDIKVMLLAAVLVGVVILLSDVIFRSFIWGGAGRSRRNNNGGGQAQIILILIALVLAILAPLIAQLIKLAISRKREYLADASAVQLTRDPSGLRSALKKISKDTDVTVDTANKATAHLFIENPLRNKKKTSFITKMFSTHPPIEDRIKALESMSY